MLANHKAHPSKISRLYDPWINASSLTHNFDTVHFFGLTSSVTLILNNQIEQGKVIGLDVHACICLCM